MGMGKCCFHPWNRRCVCNKPPAIRFPLLPDEIMKSASFDGSPAFPAQELPAHVLIVEDDPIIALDFEDTIRGFGVETIRTAASVAAALELIADRVPDFALLDVGLVREKSFAIAERLDALKIPFAFVTGYGAPETFPADFAQMPRLPKPCSSEALQAVLRRRSDNAPGDSMPDAPVK
jgi:CheY-like chemotaxis protein